MAHLKTAAALAAFTLLAGCGDGDREPEALGLWTSDTVSGPINGVPCQISSLYNKKSFGDWLSTGSQSIGKIAVCGTGPSPDGIPAIAPSSGLVVDRIGQIAINETVCDISHVQKQERGENIGTFVVCPTAQFVTVTNNVRVQHGKSSSIEGRITVMPRRAP